MWLWLVACGRPGEPGTDRPGELGRAPPGPPDLVVDCNGGADARTIQAAIDAAPEVGSIEVRPCTYRERIDFRGKSLWIWSTAGSASTVLNAGNGGVAVRATGGEGPGTALVGFQVRDAYGSAVLVDLSALRLQDVVFRSNRTTSTVDVEGGVLVLVGVRLDDTNTSSSHAIEMHRGSLVMRDVAVRCGSGDGIRAEHGEIQLDGVSLDCDGSQTLDLEHTIGWITRSKLRGDVAILSEERHPDDTVGFRNSALMGEVSVQYGSFALRNSALFQGTLTLRDLGTATLESTVFTGANCAIDTDAGGGVVRYNDFWQTASTCKGLPSVVGTDGNVAVAPDFVNPSAGDLHLRPTSGLRNAGLPDAEFDDLDGSRNDIGIYGGKFTQDGGW